MPWRPRLQDPFCLPWLLLAAPSVTLISGPLNEPARALRPGQRYLACRLQITMCNSDNLGPSIPPGAQYLNVSKADISRV